MVGVGADHLKAALRKGAPERALARGQDGWRGVIGPIGPPTAVGDGSVDSMAASTAKTRWNLKHVAL
mgnify:CR=1 FL=1